MMRWRGAGLVWPGHSTRAPTRALLLVNVLDHLVLDVNTTGSTSSAQLPRHGGSHSQICSYGGTECLTPSPTQSALFNFQSLLLVLLLLICTCTYIRGTAPALIDRNKDG